jgi:hypothetical protein
MTSAKEQEPKKKSVSLQFYIDFLGDSWGHSWGPREAVSDQGRNLFLFLKDDGFMTCEKVEEPERDVLPVQECLVPYVICNEDLTKPNTDIGELYADLHAFMSDYYVHRDPRVTKFLALYFIASYVLLRAPGIIQVWLVGKRRSGKTTLQLLAKQFCYRAFGGVNPSEASIYRFLGHLQEFAPTILVAEYDKASAFMREICREGDIPGSTVPRCDEEGRRQVVHHYHIFGARINVSNGLHGEDRDLDRVHAIHSTKGQPNRPRSDLWLNEGVMERVRSLRVRLLLWKLRNFARLRIPGEDPKHQINEGRDWEHYAAIITLASFVDSKLEDEIRTYVDESLEGMEREAGEGKTGVLVKALSVLLNEKHIEGGVYQISFASIWEETGKDATPFVADSGTEVKNKLVLENGEILTTTRAGRILKDELGGKKTSWWEGKTKTKGYEWTEENAREIKNGTGGTSGTGLEERTASRDGQKQPRNAKQGKISDSDTSDSAGKPVPPVQPVPKEGPGT